MQKKMNKNLSVWLFFSLFTFYYSLYNKVMKFYGELLIFILLFITNARILFMKKPRRDPLVSLAPVSFILSILLIFAWKVDFFTTLALIIAFIVLLSNFHAMFRYTEHLYVDHYSVLMKIWSFLTMLLSAVAILAVVYFHPVEVDNTELGITETETRLHGSFRSGFTPAKSSQKAEASVFEYTLTPSLTARQNVILFIPDKRGDTYNYRPYIQYLCKQGFTVLSGDFYTSDCKWTHTLEDSKIARRTSLTIRSLTNSQKFMSQREFFTYNVSQEINAMFNYVTEKYGESCRIFFVSDVMCNTACSDFMQTHPERIFGVFNIDSVAEYKTPGYGFVAQTDPIVAMLLKTGRDDDFSSPKIVAKETAEYIKSLLGIKTE